jgi:hypothetical protein
MKSSVFQEEFVQPAGQKALLHILINLLLQHENASATLTTIARAGGLRTV